MILSKKDRARVRAVTDAVLGEPSPGDIVHCKMNPDYGKRFFGFDHAIVVKKIGDGVFTLLPLSLDAIKKMSDEQRVEAAHSYRSLTIAAHINTFRRGERKK